MSATYKRCTTTVMDTSDPSISFNSKGECGYVGEVRSLQESVWFPNEEGQRRLEQVIDVIKRDGKGRPYDCIVGLSGGLDSSYLAYKMAQYDLRVLAVHVDGGWNSETSVKNIEKICNFNNWELNTFVVNWEEMKDLQLSFLKAGLVNQDIPQDHAFFSKLWQTAVKLKLRWALSGGNVASESILPIAWRGHNAMDSTHLRSVHARFGTTKLKTYPSVGCIRYNMYYRLVKKMKVLKPLNYMRYVRTESIRELVENTGWTPYGDKHHESVFTKFFQGYYLPTKFGYDKRKAHLSSMILSGQLTREGALAELEKLPYEKSELHFQKEYISKKLGIEIQELERLIECEPMRDEDFKSDERMRNTLLGMKQFALRHISLKGREYG